jgi:hypothetical protein
VYIYLLKHYLCAPDPSLFATKPIPYNLQSFEPDLSAALRVLGEQAGCVDAIKVIYSYCYLMGGFEESF